MLTSRQVIAGLLFAACAPAATFSGASAFEFTKQSVDFGPRPSGSEANRKLQAYIASQLKVDGCEPAPAKKDCELIEDSFTATTPRGSVPMKNIIAKFPGKSGRSIVIAGHFDTKLFPGHKFVGANDGGSSTGLLLELAHVLAHQPRIDDVYVVFFDGEEAVGEWSDKDSVYGSKHLAARWRGDGTLKNIKAFILVDMIGDKNLDIKREPTGSPMLTRLVWDTAADLGYSANFLNEAQSIEDDHLPFLKLGITAIDIIDFDYPPWHTDDDTMDKLSAQSLEIVGKVVVESIHRLEQK
jgi:glutaminyl-peptide cyclotransferase